MWLYSDVLRGMGWVFGLRRREDWEGVCGVGGRSFVSEDAMVTSETLELVKAPGSDGVGSTGCAVAHTVEDERSRVSKNFARGFAERP